VSVGLEKIEREIKNWQSRDTGHVGHEDKQTDTLIATIEKADNR
jgi:hypothetical protein